MPISKTFRKPARRCSRLLPTDCEFDPCIPMQTGMIHQFLEASGLAGRQRIRLDGNLVLQAGVALDRIGCGKADPHTGSCRSSRVPNRARHSERRWPSPFDVLFFQNHPRRPRGRCSRLPALWRCGRYGGIYRLALLLGRHSAFRDVLCTCRGLIGEMHGTLLVRPRVNGLSRRAKPREHRPKADRDSDPPQASRASSHTQAFTGSAAAESTRFSSQAQVTTVSTAEPPRPLRIVHSCLLYAPAISRKQPVFRR